MIGLRSISKSVASAVAATLLVLGLCGGSCFVAYCSEDCDPCVAKCKCSTVCNNPQNLGFEGLHRLSAYRVSASFDPEGAYERTFTDIVGLSLDFAQGPVEHSAADHTRFAEGVIDVNAWLLAPGGTEWTAEPVQVFQTGFVVPFRGESPWERLDFLFDRRGNLVEIHQALPPGR